MGVEKQLYEALLSAKQLLGKLPPDGIPELEGMEAEHTACEIEEALEAYARDDHRPQYIGDIKELDG
tara:strand:+ start:8481 stop:8681 length:201 start_codon:yes stop_codon:yes gene_type:complete